MEPKLNRVPSGAIDAPLKRSGADIKAMMFMQASHDKAGSTEMVVENNVNRALVNEIRFFLDNNANQKWDANIDFETFRYKIFVFISKDATYLNKAFELTQPLENELCIFLEDNEGDIFSQNSTSIKIGTALRTDEERLKKIAINDTLAEMQHSLPGNSFHIGADDLATLIQYGEIQNVLSNSAFGLLQAINFLNIALGKAASLIGNGVLNITTTLREYVKFKPQHWDPLANATKDNMASTNDDFEPVLFPYSNDLIGFFLDSPEQGIEEITNAMIQKLNQFKAAAQDNFSRQASLDFGNETIYLEEYGLNPDSVHEFINEGYHKIDSLFRFLIDSAAKAIPTFKYLGTSILNVVNAFYCGLWNSITEIVLGIIDFVGYLLKVFGAMGEFWTDPSGKISTFFELLDEIIQSFYAIDFVKVIQQVIDSVTSINLYVLTKEISLERVAYYLGAFGGFVIELIISFLFSSGTLSLAKFGSFGAKLMSKVQASAGNLFVKGVSKSLPKQTVALLFHYLKQALTILKLGTDEIIRIIQSFFEDLVDLVKLGNKVVQKITRKFNITPEESKLMNDLKINFVEFKGGMATACKIDLT